MRKASIVVLLASASITRSAVGGPPNHGTLDATFGNGGLASANDGTGYSIGGTKIGVARGLIHVSGGVAGPTSDTFVARFRPSGALDVSYGTNGFTRFDLGGDGDEQSGFELFANGRVMVSGYSLRTYPPCGTGTPDFAGTLIRRHSNGAPDNTFAGGSYLTETGCAGTYPSTPGDVLWDVDAEAEGAVYATGWGEIPGYGIHPLVTKTDASGAPDPAFGSGGISIIQLGDNDWSTAIEILPPSLVPGATVMTVGGAARVAGDPAHLVVAWWTASGALHSTMVPKRHFLPLPNEVVWTYQLAEASRGGWFLPALVNWNGVQTAAVFKLSVDGALDPSWGGTGYVILSWLPADSVVSGVAELPNGQVAFAGTSDFVNGKYEPIIGLLEADGSVDTWFGVNGLLPLSLPDPAGVWGVVYDDANARLLFTGFAYMPATGTDEILLVSVIP